MGLRARGATDVPTRSGGYRSGPTRSRGALLINLGTPDGPDVPSVRRYLAEFLSDPEVIRLPKRLRWLNGPLGWTIALFRARGSAEMYRRIWTGRGSPLRTITEDQAAALQAVLPDDWRVFYAMRYGRPSIREVVEQIERASLAELVVVPMYPQFSGPTTGTALNLFYQHLAQYGQRYHLRVVADWFDDRQYVRAQAQLLRWFVDRQRLAPQDTFLLFSAHGLPAMYIEQGDPYPDHVERSVELVANELNWPQDRYSLGFQSQLGPVPWLEPYTDDVLLELVEKGDRRVLVCPISFTADCLETLEEIDLRYREAVEKAGGELYVCPALNDFAPFIDALRHLILHGSRPAETNGCGERKARRPAASVRGRSRAADLDSLMMIGPCVAGRLGPGSGPRIAFCDEDAFRSIKRSQCDMPDVLRPLVAGGTLSEALALNTCQRFELYGLFEEGCDPETRANVLEKVQRYLFPDAPAGLRANVLTGADAWHHLLRTAAGLNSVLPGENDVVEQIAAAHRLAVRAGAAGGAIDDLVDRVLDHVERLRRDTPWGRFASDYVLAALDRIVQAEGLRLGDSRIVVVGGSTTSASVLHTLRDRFDADPRRMTLLHRGHRRGGQIKMLRKAIGDGRRVRVHAYNERAVLDAVADADVVVFGVDRHEPILTAELIDDARNWAVHPLTVFDFNMFGSTDGLGGLAGINVYDHVRLEAEVAAFADCITADPCFAEAVESAERWIARHVPGRAGEVHEARAADLRPESRATREPESRTTASTVICRQPALHLESQTS